MITNKLKDSLLKVNLNKKIRENGGAIGFFFYSLSSKLDSLLNVRDSLSLVQKRLRIIAPKPVKKIEDVTIEDYKIFYFNGSQKFVDTTLNTTSQVTRCERSLLAT